MTLLEGLERLATSGPKLIAWLRSIGDKYPDLKPTVDTQITEVEEAIVAITQLGATLKGELGDIAQFKFKPTDRPSDSF